MIPSIEYAAGYIDADGYIGINRRGMRGEDRPIYRAVMVIGSTNEPILHLIQQSLGHGHVGLSRPAQNSRKAVWQWYEQSTERLIPSLERLHPWLIIKQREAEIVMAFCRRVQDISPRGGGKLPDSEYVLRAAMRAELEQARTER